MARQAAPLLIGLGEGEFLCASDLRHQPPCPTSVFYASEFRYAPPPLSANTLTIGVTQSGETADALAALAMEQERRQRVGGLALTP